MLARAAIPAAILVSGQIKGRISVVAHGAHTHIHRAGIAVGVGQDWLYGSRCLQLEKLNGKRERFHCIGFGL